MKAGSDRSKLPLIAAEEDKEENNRKETTLKSFLS